MQRAHTTLHTTQKGRGKGPPGPFPGKLNSCPRTKPGPQPRKKRPEEIFLPLMLMVTSFSPRGIGPIPGKYLQYPGQTPEDPTKLLCLLPSSKNQVLIIEGAPMGARIQILSLIRPDTTL